MVMIKKYDIEFLRVKDLREGTQAMINSEFKPDSRFPNSKYVGSVIVNNEEFLLGISSWSAVNSIVAKLGNETSNWIGKIITYRGMKQNPKNGKMYRCWE